MGGRSGSAHQGRPASGGQEPAGRHSQTRAAVSWWDCLRSTVTSLGDCVCANGTVRARPGRVRGDRPRRPDRAGQRPDGSAVRVPARRAAGAAGGDARPRALPRGARGAPRGVLRRSAHAADGRGPPAVRPPQRRQRVPRRDQPVEHRDRGGTARDRRDPRRQRPRGGGPRTRAAGDRGRAGAACRTSCTRPSAWRASGNWRAASRTTSTTCWR